MTQYTCIHCGAIGASGTPTHQSPPSYHCHRCGARDALYPTPVVRLLEAEREKVVTLEAAVEQLEELLTHSVSGLEWWRDEHPWRWVEADEEHLSACRKALANTPATALARRDLLKRAEGMADAARRLNNLSHPKAAAYFHSGAVRFLEYQADKLRSQAEGGDL